MQPINLTVDAFSGRQNPTIEIPRLAIKSFMELLGDNKLLSGALFPLPPRLGYRGLKIDIPAEFVIRYRIPNSLTIAADVPATHVSVLKGLLDFLKALLLAGEAILAEIVDILEGVLKWIRGSSPKVPALPKSPAGGCAYETLPYVPADWNDPAYIVTNNCYAYAANKRDIYPSKPQPGIATGAMFTPPPTGPDVAAAARRDGAHDAGDCFPPSEAPRSLVALVIWPGQDYHWYRKHASFWGHKPGSTMARNIDNSGTVITDPSTCDRGPYTIFHGYMLMPRSQRVAA